MKRLILLFVLFVPLMCGAKKSEPTRLRLCSFNIRIKANEDVPIGASWETRRDRACQYILDNNIDIVCFQEVTTEMLPDIVERLPQFGHREQGRMGNPKNDEMTPVFYRKDKYEELAHGTFWYSETPDSVGSKSWDAYFPRVATWIKLRDKQTKQIFVATSTHFDHRGQVARRESGRMLPGMLQKIAGKYPAFVAGDFNTTRGSDAYSAIVGNPYVLRDAYFMSPKHTGVRYTVHCYSTILPKDAPTIDFMFLSKHFQVLQTHYEPDIPDAPLSDHNPIWADLEF